MSNPLWDAIQAGQPNPNHPILQFASGAALSTGEFFGLSAKLAHTLNNAGIQPGDRVAVQVPKCAEALSLYIACLRAGAVFLPLNTAYTESELAYFVQDATPKLIVLCPTDEAMGKRLVASVNAELHTLGANGNGSLLIEAKKHSATFDTVDRTSDDLAAILYTSGTTGRSKGAMLTQGNLLSNAQSLVSAWEFSSNDVLLHALPIFHTHGLFVASNTLFLCGGSMILIPKFDKNQMLELLPKATTLMGVPTFYTRLLAEEKFTKTLVSHIRLFTSGSAPLLAETHVAFEQRTGHRILERYGMTETNMTTSNPYHGERIAGTVGCALPNVELRIVDPDSGAICEHNEVGMLEVRGPNVFPGYWKMPEKTAEEFKEDGYFITGDLASTDANGYVTIVGRGKDLIISGGFNIYPKEIELLLDECTGVSESAVVAAKHPDFGEAVVAFVVRNDAAPTTTTFTENAELESELIAAIADDLAKFKQPKRVLFVHELPRNTMGKVQKTQLRELTTGLF